MKLWLRSANAADLELKTAAVDPDVSIPKEDDDLIGDEESPWCIAF